jgi:hypothetical protein
MKKTTLITVLALGLAGVANAGTIYSATTGNSTLIDNEYASTGSPTLTESNGYLVVYNDNGGFNAAGFTSTADIETLNGTALTDYDTVTIKLTVDSISGDLRSQGVQFGMYPAATTATEETGMIIGVEANNLGGDVNIRASFQDIGVTGYKGTDAELYNGFTMTLTADVAGYTFVLESIGATSPITVSGTFAGTEFLDNFGTGHFYFAEQKWNTGPLTSTLSEASITVESRLAPALALAPTSLSLELFGPATSTNGTLTLSYTDGVNSSSDIEVVSLVASNGFSASMVDSTLGLGNTTEDIIVTFTNSVGLENLLDATNSTLVISWSEVGSGVTNTSEAALDVTYIPATPSAPDHGLVLFEAATDNTVLLNNAYNGDESNVTLTGATPDLLLAVDGGNFFVGGFVGTDSINTLLGTSLTSNDTVMASLTVDAITHTDLSELRSNGIEWGIAAEATIGGSGSSSNFIVRIGGGGNSTAIQLSGESFGTITSSVFTATEASVNDGFSAFMVADEAGFTIYFEGLEAVSGYVQPISGTFEAGRFASAFGTGHYYAVAQKRYAGTTTLDISDATMSVTATEQPVFTGTSVSNGNLVMEFTGSVGRGYTVETTENLTLPNSWETATNITSLPESPMSIELPTSSAAAFFRIIND